MDLIQMLPIVLQMSLQHLAGMGLHYNPHCVSHWLGAVSVNTTVFQTTEAVSQFSFLRER